MPLPGSTRGTSASAVFVGAPSTGTELVPRGTVLASSTTSSSRAVAYLHSSDYRYNSAV
jgi:hypothetical protein